MRKPCTLNATERGVPSEVPLAESVRSDLAAFLERGYTFERMLGDVSENSRLERSLVMEKIF